MATPAEAYTHEQGDASLAPGQRYYYDGRVWEIQEVLPSVAILKQVEHNRVGETYISKRHGLIRTWPRRDSSAESASD